MNQAASHPASRGELQRATEREGVLKARQESYKQKKRTISGEMTFGDKRVLLGGLCHLPLGDRESPCDRVLYWC